MTPAEARAFNSGVLAVLAIASKSAATLARDPRRIPISFATAALAELAEAARTLLLPIETPQNREGNAAEQTS